MIVPQAATGDAVASTILAPGASPTMCGHRSTAARTHRVSGPGFRGPDFQRDGAAASSSRAMISFWISLVPSYSRYSRESRYSRSTTVELM